MPNPSTDRCGGSRSRRRSGSEVRSATSLVRAGHDPGNRQLVLNVHKKRRIWEPPLPDLVGMMAHYAGNSRHNRPSCRLEIPVRSRYLEFMCQQVLVRFGNPAILHAQRPTGGTVRMWWSPPYTQSTAKPGSTTKIVANVNLCRWRVECCVWGEATELKRPAKPGAERAGGG